MSIEVRGLCCGYRKEEVLRSVDFTARSGEVTVIIGSNGAGKTTLLRCILGLLSPKAGSILVGGRRAETLSRRESARLMAYVPQICFPSFNFRCVEIVMMGANNRTGMFSSPPQGEEEFALACMEKMGVASLRDRPFFETSGGERQLLLIARALMQKAPVLLLDEPVANLDFGNQTRVMGDIRKLAKEGYCVVLTSHNPEQTYLYADKVAALGDGRMLLEGTREEVVSEEVISKLYGLDVSILRLLGDRMRVCVPRSVCDE